MRLLILGGTGPCGQLLIEEAIGFTHSVVVFARSPDKLPDSIKSNPAVTIVQGQLTDEAQLDKAMEGVDAVLSALGPSVSKGPFHPADTPLAHAYSSVLRVMKKHGVKRLIALGTASIKDSNDKFSTRFATLVTGVALFAHSAYKDVVAIGEVIRKEGSGLDWTIVRVPLLTDDPDRDVVAGYVGDSFVRTHLSRSGFATFVLQQLDSSQWSSKAPLISNPHHSC